MFNFSFLRILHSFGNKIYMALEPSVAHNFVYQLSYRRDNTVS